MRMPRAGWVRLCNTPRVLQLRCTKMKTGHDAHLWAQLLTALETQNLRSGLRIPGLIRFGAATDAYIGNTNGGPRMYWNLEDHLSHSTGERNVPFEARCRGLLTP